MAVTLAEAKRNAQEEYDPAIIDEFRKESVILDSLIFDDIVNPAGGGATLDFGYRRQVTQPTAATRAIGTGEYTPSEVTSEKVTGTLAVLGGAFTVDRVLAKVGPAASGAISHQLDQKIKATRTHFQDLVINGDTLADSNAFDGLDKALTGSSTEIAAGPRGNWADLDTDASVKHKALDLLDDFLGELDGAPTLILGNKAALAKVRAIVRRTGAYTRDPIDGLLGQNGRPIVREAYGNIWFADPGDKAGTSDPIIPLYDADNAVWVVTNNAGADGGTFKLEVRVGGRGSWQETAAIAYNATGATIDAAVEALSNVGAGNVAVTGSAAGPWTATFGGALAGKVVEVRVSDQSTTDGGVPVDVTVAETAATGGLTDLYAVRIGLDGFHGVTTIGSQIVSTYLPDLNAPGAIKRGEVEMGPVGVALKATKAAAVLRGIRVR